MLKYSIFKFSLVKSFFIVIFNRHYNFLNSMYKFFFSCQLGFEELLKKEIEQIQTLMSFSLEPDALRLTTGGIELECSLEHAYQIMLWSHIAARTLLLISKQEHVETDIDLFNAAYSINWTKYINSKAEIKVEFLGTNEFLKNSHYNSLRVKDAICDRYQKEGLSRPIINTDSPDIVIQARFHRGVLSVYLDLMGPMHKRHRKASGAAPLRETLAAALLMKTNWDKASPIVDPMCGSGVFLVEAALMALQRAPGLLKKENEHHLAAWLGFKQDSWLVAREQAASKALTKKAGFKAFGSDVDEFVLSIAKDNAAFAGVSQYIQWTVQSVERVDNITGADKGLVIVNPPYGVRLGSVQTLVNTYQLLGKTLKFNFPGFKVGIISSDDILLKSIGLKASKSWKVRNANLDCFFKLYDISNRPPRVIEPNLETELAVNDNFANAGENNFSSAVHEQKVKSKANQKAEKIVPELDLTQKSFINRLEKNKKALKKYLSNNKIDCYRLYDADIPEYNVSVDVYGDYYILQEYAAPKFIDEYKAHKRLMHALDALNIFAQQPAQNIILKQRKKQEGAKQYQRLSNKSELLIVEEYGARFKVNLTDYIDTGIFLDHREVRHYIQQNSKGKRFLNLFSYTATASVHAILGGALSSVTVDMSATYCNWAFDNYELNNIYSESHRIEEANVLEWLDDAQERITLRPSADYYLEKFDFIFIDPPTFSNSKSMRDVFDVQYDHLDILLKLKNLLNAQGCILFSNNKRGFKLAQAELEENGFKVKNITNSTMPLDFKDSKIHQAWLLSI